MTATGSFWEQAASIFGRPELRAALGPDVQPRLLGRLLALAADELAGAARLDAIPSETTAAERRFLLAFLARVWRGEQSVLEIGPFLGGTTRALALGMLASPRRAPAARLFTYDRFASYHKPDALHQKLAPLVAVGALPARLLASIDAAASFRAVFDALHAGTDYGALVCAAEARLPDQRDDPAALFALPAERTFDLVFVDGCKSWYATKAFLREIAPRVPRGAHLIFQDYGWFTCFWIPAFVHGLRDCLELVAHVDATYAFELVRPLEAAAIERGFPDDTASLGEHGIERLFGELQAGACARSDVEARAFHALQEVGALRAIGALAAARQRFDALCSSPWSGRPLELVAAARRAWNLAPAAPPHPRLAPGASAVR